MIYSVSKTGVVAQGNLTTGRINAGSTSATNSSNYNYTHRGGTATLSYGGNSILNPMYMNYTAKPDAMVVWVKFEQPKGTLASYPYAKVSATIHDDYNFEDHFYASQSDRNNDSANINHIVGQASNQQILKTDWTRLIIPFEYTSNTNAKYILISAATNAYPGKGYEDDKLYLDDISFIYFKYNLKTDTNGWATLFLDYAALVPNGATAYYINSVKTGYAQLVAIPAGQVIPKNTAVLIKGSANTTYAFNGSAADIKGKTIATVSGNLLNGTTTQISRPSGTCRVLSSESSSSMAAFGAFTGSTIAANTAWLTE